MFDHAHYLNLISEVDQAVTASEKGSRFESLIQYLLQTLDGVDVTERDIHMPSEEIDLVLWNAQREEVLRPWEAVILVECKNWSSSVGAAELDNFLAKLRRRSLKTGIFVAAAGVSGTFISGRGRDEGAVGVIRAALQEGIRVITITMNDLRAISSADDLRNLIKKRYCSLYVHRIL